MVNNALDNDVQPMALQVRRIREEVNRLLERCDSPPTSLEMALLALDETLLRLGVPLPCQAEYPEDDPLVLGIEPWIFTNERLDCWTLDLNRRIAGSGQ